MLAVLIATDQFANVGTAGPESPVGHLRVDKRLEGRGKRDVHRAHRVRVALLTKIGKQGLVGDRRDLGTGKPLKNVVSADAVAASASPGAARSANPLQIQEHEFDNGFTILLAEDHRRPRVAANLWVRVGSMIEP